MLRLHYAPFVGHRFARLPLHLYHLQPHSPSCSTCLRIAMIELAFCPLPVLREAWLAVRSTIAGLDDQRSHKEHRAARDTLWHRFESWGTEDPAWHQGGQARPASSPIRGPGHRSSSICSLNRDMVLRVSEQLMQRVESTARSCPPCCSIDHLLGDSWNHARCPQRGCLTSWCWISEWRALISPLTFRMRSAATLCVACHSSTW